MTLLNGAYNEKLIIDKSFKMSRDIACYLEKQMLVEKSFMFILLNGSLTSALYVYFTL
jgi:hypothetical protein